LSVLYQIHILLYGCMRVDGYQRCEEIYCFNHLFRYDDGGRIYFVNLITQYQVTRCPPYQLLPWI